MRQQATTNATGEFRLRHVEGGEDWCSNPRLLNDFRKHHARWREGHRQQPSLFTFAQLGANHKRWSAPGFQLNTYLVADFMDFEDHDGAHVEVWRCTLRFV